MNQKTDAAFRHCTWRKSSRSQGANDCVEVAFVGPTTAVRDSKNPDADYLVLTPTQWACFLGHAKAGGLTR